MWEFLESRLIEAQFPSLENEGVESSPRQCFSNIGVSADHLGFTLNCSPEPVGVARACYSAFVTIINSSQVMPKLLVHGPHSKELIGIKTKWNFGGLRSPDIPRHALALETRSSKARQL